MSDIALSGQGFSSAILAALVELYPQSYSIQVPGVGLPPLGDLIDQVCGEPDSYEANEPPPTSKAKDDLKRLVDDASLILNAPLPVGDIAPYFGEVSITWRNRERMVRATSFSDKRRPRLDFGSTPSGSLGDYSFDENATGEKLAQQLEWLFQIGEA